MKAIVCNRKSFNNKKNHTVLPALEGREMIKI